MRLYNELIITKAVYGCETWTLRNGEEKQLLPLVFEMSAHHEQNEK